MTCPELSDLSNSDQRSHPTANWTMKLLRISVTWMRWRFLLSALWHCMCQNVSNSESTCWPICFRVLTAYQREWNRLRGNGAEDVVLDQWYNTLWSQPKWEHPPSCCTHWKNWVQKRLRWCSHIISADKNLLTNFGLNIKANAEKPQGQTKSSSFIH